VLGDGYIRNIALRTTFLAAQHDEMLDWSVMRHVVIVSTRIS
jgi:hypothetical protein